MEANPLQDEIRSARDEILSECNFDLARLSEYIRQFENQRAARGAPLCHNARAYAEAHPEPRRVTPVPYEPIQPNPILEEIRAIRDEMARGANYDSRQ